MIDLADHQYPGNQRWGIHASNPHHPGCWCGNLRHELDQLIAPLMPPGYDWLTASVVDRLLTADTLRIELR